MTAAKVQGGALITMEKCVKQRNEFLLAGQQWEYRSIAPHFRDACQSGRPLKEEEAVQRTTSITEGRLETLLETSSCVDDVTQRVAKESQHRPPTALP